MVTCQRSHVNSGMGFKPKCWLFNVKILSHVSEAPLINFRIGNVNKRWWGSDMGITTWKLEILVKSCLAKDYLSDIYEKRAKNIQWGKDSLNKWCWENCTAIWKRMELDHYINHTQKLTQNGLKTWWKIWNHKAPRRKHRQQAPWHWSWQWIFGFNTKS